jgi:hypothetical protein
MALLGILETAIGLAFIYLLLSMLCSGINEWLAHRLGRRGRCLRAGLLNLVPDRWAYLRLLSHPAVASLYRDMKGRIRHPAYIPSATFVTALTDVVRTIAANIQSRQSPPGAPPQPPPDIRAAAEICAQHGHPIGKSILAIIDRKPLDGPDDAGKRIEAWYDGTIERVSGWYKRTARFQLFLIGFAAAAALNVDSLAIGRQLLHADALRSALVADATRMTDLGASAATTLDAPERALLKEQVERLLDYKRFGLAIGYSCPAEEATRAGSAGTTAARSGSSPASSAAGQAQDKQEERSWLARQWSAFKACGPDSAASISLKFLGWLITAFAVSQGAPFWFDLMNRFINLRGSGPKPGSVAGAAR